MKFSAMKLCALVGLASLVLLGLRSHAQPVVATNNRVTIYPTSTEKIDQLQQKGIKVENHGSYWLAEATDAQVIELTRMYGARAIAENGQNRIRLGRLSFNTSDGEPSVPENLRQKDGAGFRLRLIQFRDPISSASLQLLKSAGAQAISYVPDNAYLAFMDSGAEKRLEKMRETGGPIQWIGAYHPYYKIAQELQSASGTEPLKVRVAIVDRPQEESGVFAMGVVRSSLTRGGQQIVDMEVQPSAIAKMARLADVLWIQKVVRHVPLDEVQDLLITTQTNAPGHGPSTVVGITNYLDFLTNTVGGGLVSFTNQAAYPVVDVADTGLDVGLRRDQQDQPVVAQPAFLDANGRSRVAYLEPGINGYFPAPEVAENGELGCPGLNDNFNQNDILHSADDFYGHGTLVASIISGYDVQTNALSFIVYSTIETQRFDTNTVCLGVGTVTNLITFPTSPCPVTTGIVVNCTSPGTVFLTISLPTEVIHTVPVFSADDHRDLSGFQVGLGVSPFGSIGASRIWSQAAHVNSANQVVIDGTTFCINSLPSLVASAYFNGARIQNNSWSDELQTDGSNGGEYTTDSQNYDIAVRDALLVGGGATNANVPGPSPLNQELIVVFAANNLLGDGGAGGTVGGFGDIRITAPSTAKNVITVGSSDSVRLDGSGCAPDSQESESLNIPPFTAFGPTLDGRFKPEIVAPGTTIFGATTELALYNDPVVGINHLVNRDPSGNLGEGIIVQSQLLTNLYTCPPFTNTTLVNATTPGFGLYVCASGSSYAAPAVSGGIQLLWWYFENRLTNELGQALLQPSPAMAKAYICNAARYLPLGNTQGGPALETLPSYAEGMGELDLLRMFDGMPRAIRDESTPRAIDSALITTNPAPQQTYFSQSGQSYEVSGQVASDGLPFRVTLAWTDAPGPGGSGPQLVNDLNLEVTIGGVTYNGNNFFENVSVTNNHIDAINNMESVFVNPTNMLNGILAVTNGAPFQVIVHAKNIAGNGVPNVGESVGAGSNTLNQDFALVIYNAATNTLTDVPNLAVNNSCATAFNVTQFPFTFTNFLTKAVYNNVQPSPSAARGGVDEFFKLTLPTPGTTFTVNTLGSTFDTVLSVWSVQVIPQTVLVRGECGALTEVVSTNDLTHGSQVSFTADGSNDYFIVIEPHNNIIAPGSNMVLNVAASCPPITIAPASLTFPSQVMGTTSAGQIVTYQNGLPISVGVSGVSIGGSNSADFVILSQGCAGNSIAAGGNCATLVAFAPTTNGLRQATLVFTDDAICSPRTVLLSGTATPSAPIVCLSQGSTLVFSNQSIGSTSAPPQSVTVTNCGSLPLHITNVSLTGSALGDFSWSTNGSTTVAAGGIVEFDLSFSPTAPGTRQATFRITHDAGSPSTVALQGVGTTPAAGICFGRSSIDFGSVGTGGTNTTPSVTITNCGTAPLVITGINVTGADAADFIVTGTTCATVPVGGACQVDVQFSPPVGNGGTRTASLAISDNIFGSPQLLPLTGFSSLSQPDAAIGKTTKLKKMIGFGVKNTTGVGQQLTQNVHRGAKKGKKYYVTVANVGSSADRFNVTGTASSGGFTVNYFLGAKPSESVDVTAAAVANPPMFATSTLAPGTVTDVTSMIRVEVSADKTVAKGTTMTFLLKFSSSSGGQDTVQITAIAK